MHIVGGTAERFSPRTSIVVYLSGILTTLNISTVRKWLAGLIGHPMNHKRLSLFVCLGKCKLVAKKHFPTVQHSFQNRPLFRIHKQMTVGI